MRGRTVGLLAVVVALAASNQPALAYAAAGNGAVVPRPSQSPKARLNLFDPRSQLQSGNKQPLVAPAPSPSPPFTSAGFDEPPYADADVTWERDLRSGCRRRVRRERRRPGHHHPRWRGHG